MCISGSLIIAYDDKFFEDNYGKFTTELGKQIQLWNPKFKVIVLEVMPITAEHLNYFKSFSRITIKKIDFKKGVYQQIRKILPNTGILFIFLSHPMESQRLHGSIL